MTAVLILAVWFVVACAVAPFVGRLLARRSAELEEPQ
jgi:hypothetical protein